MGLGLREDHWGSRGILSLGSLLTELPPGTGQVRFTRKKRLLPEGAPEHPCVGEKSHPLGPCPLLQGEGLGCRAALQPPGKGAAHARLGGGGGWGGGFTGHGKGPRPGSEGLQGDLPARPGETPPRPVRVQPAQLPPVSQRSLLGF